jgi:3-methyl-2-oxobutanoate hydroxymethyltransferase
MSTAYDTCFARLAEEAEVDILLVGDSAANVLFGMESTQELSSEIMALLVRAVSKGAPNTHIVADMPYTSVQNAKTALRDALFFLKQGAHSVKVEGTPKPILETLIQNGIPVMGHLGLLPQTATSLKQVGVKEEEALLEQAFYLESIGVFSVVLEHIDYSMAKKVTESLSVPTIGIGAGSDVSGQVLVCYDLLGMNKGPLPPFVKEFGQVQDSIQKGFRQYAQAVREKKFP